MKKHIPEIILLCLLVFVYLVGVGMGRSSVPDQPATPIIIPTCEELDSYGYDGLATCVNTQGELVTPGSD